MWHEVIRTMMILLLLFFLSAHLRATPEEGGVGIWEVVFQKNPVTNRGHQLGDVVLHHDDGLRVKRRSGISVVQARTRGETEGRPVGAR